MKKGTKRCVFFLVLMLFFTLPTAAEAPDSNTKFETEYEHFLQEIPPEVAELLPKAFFEAGLAQSEATIKEASGIESVLSVVGKLTGLAIRENLSMLAQICGLLLLGAVLRMLVQSKESGIGRAFGFFSTLTLTLLLLSLQGDRLAHFSAFFDTVKALSLSFLPLMGTLYAMGGNVRVAAVNHSVLSTFLSILETLCAGTVLPIAGICLAFAMMDALTGRTQLRGLAAFVKRTYTVLISFLMTLLCFVLGTQSTLAKAGDSLAIRTARFAAGSFLPLVGGSVSESLRTAAASVSYLRGVAGSGVILVLFFVFLPLFLSILLTRITFLLGGCVAGLLSCEQEGKILSELASVYGYFLGILAVIFIMLLFSLTLFARCAVAG